MDKSILTVSSNVVHGYVGNKSITFPLQTLDWNVNIINTVNYSNHTGYGTFNGTMITTQLLEKLLRNDTITEVKFIITGYLPNSDIINVVEGFLKNNQQLIYLFDPILGDEDQLYVDESCIASFKQLLQNVRVDIITPNQFELEILTGIKIGDWKSCIHAITSMSQKVEFVVLTSVQLPAHKDTIYVFGATDNKVQYFEIPLIDCYFTGVGDLFTGILIDKLYDNYYKHAQKPDKITALMKSINQVLYIMSQVLESTAKNGMKYGKAKMGDLSIGKFELNLIESRDLFSADNEVYTPRFLSEA